MATNEKGQRGVKPSSVKGPDKTTTTPYEGINLRWQTWITGIDAIKSGYKNDFFKIIRDFHRETSQGYINRNGPDRRENAQKQLNDMKADLDDQQRLLDEWSGK